MNPPPFRFFPASEVFNLTDHELTLVEPHAQYIDDLLHACHHPLTQELMPSQTYNSRDNFETLLKFHPQGHFQENRDKNIVPAYLFWMKIRDDFPSDIRMAGTIGLRLASTQYLELYLGHIGYHVYPAARGHHFALRACKLILPLARAHGYSSLWITCNPDNIASRKTCEQLGGIYVNTLDLPPDNPLYQQGDRQKVRYRLDL